MAQVCSGTSTLGSEYADARTAILCDEVGEQALWLSEIARHVLAPSYVDHPRGTRDLIKQLASSPLVRKTLPHAAAICSQYFSSHHQNESMGLFLNREALGFAEFTEALERLYDEKKGVAQVDRDFGIPIGTYYDETELDMKCWAWYYDGTTKVYLMKHQLKRHRLPQDSRAQQGVRAVDLQTCRCSPVMSVVALA